MILDCFANDAAVAEVEWTYQIEDEETRCVLYVVDLHYDNVIFYYKEKDTKNKSE